MAEDFPKIPGYKIEKRLGQGGMATVYLAVQESFGRHVALKIMSSSLGEDDVWARRFIKEAQIVAQLSHPNIVPVFDVGTYEGRFYISMECMKGGDLEGKMATGISIPDVLKVIVGVAAGLDFAGEKGFVHRDIKPDNVMFREDGSPVILDFGIVKQMGGGSDDKMTKTGTIVGTTAYMSPEQAQGKELDQRSDIYSLGCMLYELLVGRTPYQGDSAVAVLLKHVNEPPPQLPDFISVLQPMIEKSMAKNVEDRYARARDMIEHLQELEPQIKEIVAQQQAMFNSGGAEDATGAMPAVGSNDATVATNAVTAVSEELDLTSVLSSAKATIADFSEEAQLKKARNTKRAFVVAALIIISTVAYAGFYQFYIVPKNLAVAEQQREKKVVDLLAVAKASTKGLRYSDFEAMDKTVAQFRAVLQVDPENNTAQTILESFGDKYIELAGKAVSQKELDKAETYQSYAEQLAPSNPELSVLRNSIKNIRSESTQLALEGQFKQRQIDSLLIEAKADIADGKHFLPDGNNAYATLQQVLQMDAANSEAAKLSQSLLDALYKTASKQIQQQQLRSAANSIEILKRYYENEAELASLRQEYKQAKSSANQQEKLASLEKQKEKLLVQASRLQRERRNVSVNDEMRGLYLDVLSMDSNNASALDGMQDTSDFEAKSARQSIDAREYRRATQNIQLIEQHTPNYSGLSGLKNSLSQAQRSAKKADEMLNSADQLIASGSNAKAKRSELQNAYQYIDGAQQLDQYNPSIKSYMSALESEYVLTLTQLLASKEVDLANGYFEDAAGKPWPSDRILQLQLTQQSARQKAKPKPKRVITGGF